MTIFSPDRIVLMEACLPLRKQLEAVGTSPGHYGQHFGLTGYFQIQFVACFFYNKADEKFLLNSILFPSSLFRTILRKIKPMLYNYILCDIILLLFMCTL